jgi:signal peptidase I
MVVTVIGGSMQPTLLPNDRVLTVRGRVPRHGIIVLKAPPHAAEFDIRPLRVKRLVALPGELIPETIRLARGLAVGATVPAGHIAVLGDHPKSEDSKQWGPIPMDSVVGMVQRRLSSS